MLEPFAKNLSSFSDEGASLLNESECVPTIEKEAMCGAGECQGRDVGVEGISKYIVPGYTFSQTTGRLHPRNRVSYLR